MAVVVGEQVLAQGCKPVGERIGDQKGCWILSDEKLGQLPQDPLFWHLTNYSTRAEAEAAKGARGTVIEALQKVWLSTIAEAGGPTPGGMRVAEIGPLPGISNEGYTAHYMEAVSAPGSTSRNAHRHDGPEAWYNLTGEVCLETPDGMKIAHAGESTIAPPGLPMKATTVGTELRRSLVLVLHETAKPWVTPVPDWTPEGLCKP
jgi:quercetin dioxygenase-like cupin family protein